MKRPVLLIVGAAAAAFVLAAVGASAHTAWLNVTKTVGTHASTFTDEASGARTESPEPTESPEASPKAEPSERPEPAESPEPAENEQEPAEGSGSGETEGTHTGSGHDDGGSGHHDGQGGGDD